MIERAGVFITAVLFVAAAGTALAGPEGVLEMQVDVPGPEDVESELRAKTREKIADRVVDRLQTRMRAADIKFSTVDRVDSSTVKVGIEAEHSRELLRGLALAPGKLEVRVVRHVGDRWQERATRLPDDVELRQEDNEMEPGLAYLWSERRRPLAEFLREHSFDEIDLLPYSTVDGWRSVALGETVLTHRNVEKTNIRKIPTGSPYVSVQLDAAGRKSFRNAADQLGGRLAVVLDEEIVGFVEQSSLTEGALHLSPPEPVAGGKALMRWARQIAGRLAAPLPVKIVEVEE